MHGLTAFASVCAGPSAHHRCRKITGTASEQRHRRRTVRNSLCQCCLQTNAGKFTLEAGKDATWVTPRAEANGNYTFFCTPHYDATQPRLAHFTLKSADGKISRPLVIRQLPNTSAASMADIMLPIASATAESEQPGEGIELSYNGHPSTIYHSSWGGCSLPQNLTYTLKEAAHIDYLVYTPRTGSPNGTFGEVEVFVAAADKPNEWKSVAKADCEKKNSSSTILLGEKGIDQVKKVRIQVNTAGNDGSKNFVSCAEMAFYQYNASLTAGLSEYFADALCTSLKGISSEADLVKIGHPYLPPTSLQPASGQLQHAVPCGRIQLLHEPWHFAAEAENQCRIRSPTKTPRVFTLRRTMSSWYLPKASVLTIR